MFDETNRKKAMAEWLHMLREAEIRMSAQEQYDELLKMADAMQAEGLITGQEWRQLTRDAGVVFAQTRTDLGGWA
ncbi:MULTISPECIES: hypothetical protein [unclassified Pseudomonas]|uniref:hypothetical protein n=1 Tax=unclassified Pseudomonas TaxID=196821 RepID=UPI000A1DD280|nr:MULTISPECIES: hypothetical protein [unclassified Pseudomonas]